ncbi:hypothetical protein [Dankookia sp. P2]|uniref:hypothetical protein n=1 Tax=Dankookia sp. P2 TaxID=3423955 RepID=UPI003D6692AD
MSATSLLRTASGSSCSNLWCRRRSGISENFQYWRTGVFHFCLIDPNIEELARRIAEHGGQQRSKVWSLFEGEPFKAVYCEDPWGNLIEIYSHSTELMYANRGQ